MGNIIVAVLAVVFVAGLTVLIVKKVRRGGHTRCKKCKTRYNLETDVNYEILETVSASNGTDKKVEFRCTCPKCGEVKTFTKLFPLQRIDNNDKVVHLNVENEIKEYFTK